MVVIFNKHIFHASSFACFINSFEINNDPRNLKKYLKPEKYIESDHSDILKTARSLKGENSLETAERIFNHVSNLLEYAGYIEGERGALYALRNKKGDCTEYMYLFTALCRAVGIPARCIGGYVCKENSVLKPSEYHNWAEFYANNTWNPADPLNNVFLRNRDQYIAMRVLGDTTGNPMGNFHRFRLERDGLTVKMNR